MNPILDILISTHYVVDESTFVRIDDDQLKRLTKEIADDTYKKPNIRTQVDSNGYLPSLFVDWGITKDVHFSNVNEQSKTALYIFVLTSLNFCFWPIENFEYYTLSKNLKKYFDVEGDLNEDNPFHPKILKDISPQELSKLLFNDIPNIPMIEERCRVVKELGEVLFCEYDSKIENLILSAKKSVNNLVRIVSGALPSFRDSCVYKGRQVFFYKRAQILCGDLFGAFGGKGLGELDVENITMFPDYRIPQYFNEKGVLVYSEELQKDIRDRKVLKSGSEEECEIRAASVHCVERIKEELRREHRILAKSHEIDWYLWELTEKVKDDIVPEHRVYTIFY